MWALAARACSLCARAVYVERVPVVALEAFPLVFSLKWFEQPRGAMAVPWRVAGGEAPVCSVL